MAAIDNYNLGSDLGTDFAKSTISLLKKVCTQILGEADTESGGTYTQAAVQKRHAKALQILNDKTNDSAQIVLLAITSLGTIDPQSQTLDNDIEFTINSIFDDLAGVTNEDLKTYSDTTSRVLKFSEANELLDNQAFVGGVQMRALEVSIFHRDLHQATVDAGDWATLTDVQKKQFNYGKLNLERGALDDNVAFARTWLSYLINDSVGIPIPDDGFNVGAVTKTILETTGIIGGAQIDKAYTIMMDNVQIDTPE